MRYLLALILLLVVAMPGVSMAYDVLVVMSRRDPVLEEVLNGFRSGKRFTERVVVLSDYADVDLPGIVREDHPSLVLTLGDRALAEAAKLRKTPVVALMSLDIHKYNGAPNLAGVDVLVKPKEYLAIFRGLKAKRVGVVCDPVKNGWYLRQALQDARRYGITLVVREVRNPRETLTQLESLRGKVDALWMWPDTTAVTRVTVEAYANFSMEQRVPLVSFAADYLKIGAAVVETLDYRDLGLQATMLAAEILDGTAPSELPVASPRHASRRTNPTILRRLGIDIDVLEKLSADEE